MINKIYETEMKYKMNFCDTEIFKNYIRYTDTNIEDMYSHNFIYINNNVTSEEILDIISSEIKKRKFEGKKFVNVITSSQIDSTLLDKLPLKPEIEKYLYLGISSDYYLNIKEKENTQLLLADNEKVSEDGRIIDIIANYKHMTLEFAIRRIDRKFEIYSNQEKPINLYVCYDGIEPVGNCELMINESIAKIEDFDIIEIHQRKGFGSHVLNNLLKICKNKNIEDVYLVTDFNDTAKDMYTKNGFSEVGQSTELMFRL